MTDRRSQTCNVALHLAQIAQREPDRAAIHIPSGSVRPTGLSEYSTLSFSQLDRDSDSLAQGLIIQGINRGNRIAMMIPPSADFFALTFALLKIGAIPILIDPGMGIRNLGRCLDEAGPEVFIGIPKAHLARRVFGWNRRTLRFRITTAVWCGLCDSTLDRIRAVGATLGAFAPAEVSTNETAAILFTSGSTGIAKGVVYTHGTFSAQIESLKKLYDIKSGEIDLCTFPLFALFGPALGMTCVIPDMDPTRPAAIDARKAVAQIRQFKVTNLFGSPAVLRSLAIWGDGRDEKLETLQRVISAGAPASIPVIERFSKLLNHPAKVFTPYGATEALPVSNIGSDEILTETRYHTEHGKGFCVGRPAPGMRVSVIPIRDEPIPEWNEALCLPIGEIGEFVVQGPVVTESYFNRPEATQLAKITDRGDGAIFHRMGDLGYIDKNGLLWFCGRKSQRVETPSGTLFTDQVEPIFNTIEIRTALVGVKQMDTLQPVICVERIPFGPRNLRHRNESWDEIKKRMLDLASQFQHTRHIETFLLHPRFPVDIRHNSKIFREKLAVWATQQLGKNWRPKSELAIASPSRPGGSP